MKIEQISNFKLVELLNMGYSTITEYLYLRNGEINIRIKYVIHVQGRLK